MSKEELVKYRFSRAKETFNEAILLGNEDHWNAVANRLYYACFYLVNSLLIHNDFSFSSHKGVKTVMLISKDSRKKILSPLLLRLKNSFLK